MKLPLSENICKLRKEHSMTQEQLAEALGVTFASVSKWERGVAKPELDLLAEMADLFDVSIDALMGYTINSERIESLIAQMEKCIDNHNNETAASLCERILRNYPNNDRAVSACADGYYKMYIHTGNKNYIEHCIEQTKRLMVLKQGEPERERLERIYNLGNQYELLEQWKIAQTYYEQSNVSGSSETSIARCLLHQDKTEEAINKLSNALVESVFQQYHTILTLADAWIALEQKDKACTALEWLCDVMESLHYNPTAMMILHVKLAGLYDECGKKDMLEASLGKVAALAKEADSQELVTTADFLQVSNAEKILISTTGSKELLINLANSLAESSSSDSPNDLSQ